MRDIKELIKNQKLYFDGGFGTVLQGMGLESGTPPEIWNLTNPEKITLLHKEYIESGSNIITTNTFGVNCRKYENYKEIIKAAIDCAIEAKGQREDVFIAFDMGPTGRMLEPLGDLPFEEAVEIYSNNIKEAKGVDLIIIETMNDSYETKAAVLAAKENSSLPVFVTNAYDRSGKLMTGATPEAMIAMLEGMGVDAIGMNCSFGPDAMLEIIDSFKENSSVPIIANPNAGLPQIKDGKTVFDISAKEFSRYMVKLCKKGVTILGGCCGTTPEYIKDTVDATKDIPFERISKKENTVVSSYTHAVKIENSPVLIGERINPTGKPKLKEALREKNLNYILNEGIRQADLGVHILDVNVGLPEIDESEMMKKVVFSLQSVCDVPLQLDSPNPCALESAMRIYNGKPLINSVNGEKETMDKVFPLVKKYGGAVIALTMDKSGIPETAEGRVEIAKRIIKYAEEFGIDKNEIIVDPLCLTISSDKNSALVTLEAVRLLNSEGIKTSLGVSNISFGLPERGKINQSFFSAALENGLNCAIMNPFAKGMMDVYYAHRVLHGLDEGCSEYIEYASSGEKEVIEVKEDMSLEKAIIKGLKDDAQRETAQLLKTKDPIEIIDNYIVAALGEIGKQFEEKKAYLPQLLMAAEAASKAFDVIKEKLPKKAEDSKKRVILATVKGDIHDIGKNIVKVLMESYGFKVYDLGRDTEPEKIIDCIKETGCKFVGLSALMTTTVPAMEETIRLLRENFDDVEVMVGGAVLTEEYAKMINADKYAPDAMAAVRYGNELLQ